jgi:hypothetical protein
MDVLQMGDNIPNNIEEFIPYLNENTTLYHYKD